MKKIIIVILILVSSSQTYGQKSRQGEMVELKSSINLIPFNNDIQKISNDSILNCDKPIVIFFWLSTCVPCIKELNLINTNPGFIKHKNQIKIIVVSDDKVENHEKAKFISKKFNWWFDLYFDYGYALRNNLLNNWFGVPQSMIIDKNKTITLHKFGYCQGDEKIILNKVIESLEN